MTFKKWILELFEDERGAVSIKPVIAFIGSLTLFITMIISCFVGKTFAPSDALIDAVMIITGIGMGSDTVDKFSFKNKIPTITGNNSATNNAAQPDEGPDI